nr:MAG TPA: Ig-like domain protein [Caudoviricetes sp.]
MADTFNFDSLLNTTAGMTAIVKNVRKGNTIIDVTGMDWFTYAGRTVSTIHVNGNSWIRFGAGSKNHLEICYRYKIGVIYYLYRQEGILESGKKFLKIRIEGYAHDSSTLPAYTLKYEVFLIEGQTLFINVIKRPTNNNYIGTSSITDGSTTKTLTITASTAVPIYILVKNAGIAQKISYEKYSDEVVIKATKIEIISLPSKLKYKKDESFNGSGLVVKATYNNGTSAEISDYVISYPDMSSAGTKTVTVTYDDQTATFDITVIAIAKIEITTPPIRTEYHKGDMLDTTGMVVSTVWTDGSREVLADGYTVSELDSAETGEKTITVTYQTFTATFTVEVVADTAGIRISHYPNKVYYKIGETLDTTGLAVAKYRADGTEVEITGYTVSDLDSSTSGSKTVNVFYTETISSTESKTFNTDFQVRVTKDGNNPFDDSSDGDSGGGSGDVEEKKTEPINVTVHWINGEFADLTNENIDQNTLTLQESICSEQYFIFGGCVCNQITFQAHHDQFNGTSEEFYPSGKIEVYIERKGTKIKIFTGEIDSAERKANSLTRNFIAYDYLYKLRNTDIARWYKNQTTDKKKKLTQKQFRDKLFEFLGLEQVSTKLHWDDAYVPDTNNSNEMNVVNILKDLCLQNDRFGWMNRDGKFEYLKLRQNSYRYGQTTDNQNIYKYYNNEEIHLDTFKSFTAKEGRIWFPNVIFCDPDPNRAFGFTQGDYTAQEAYDNNVYYNRNSFFVGNEDWLNYVWNADEYGGISRVEPIMKICYGVFVDQDLRKYYRAQGYTAEVQGNPLNMVGQAVELYYKKQIQHDDQEPTELQWYVHSYIMSRTLKIGATDMIDTYSANNAPFNSNSQQLGKYTPEISGTVNLTRSEMPTISYAEFTDGSDSEFSPATIDDFTDGSGDSGSTSEQLKKAQLRCVKRIKKADYDALVAAGTDRADTLYFTFEEE